MVIGRDATQVYESHWVKAVSGSSQDEMDSSLSALGEVLNVLTQFETGAYCADESELLCSSPGTGWVDGGWNQSQRDNRDIASRLRPFFP